MCDEGALEDQVYVMEERRVSLTLETSVIDDDMGRIPERRLWLAVLTRAIQDVVRYNLDIGDAVYRPAILNLGIKSKQWFLSDSTEIGSFLWVCVVLNIANPEKLTCSIMKMKSEDLKKTCDTDVQT